MASEAHTLSPATFDRTVPSWHVAMLERFAKQRNACVDSDIRRLGLSPDPAGDPRARVCAGTYSELLRVVAERGMSSDFFFDFGRELTLVALGELGQLLLASGSARQALPSLCRYYGIIGCGTSLRFEDRGDAYIVLLRLVPSDSLEARIKTEVLAGAFAHNAKLLTGVASTALRFEFDYRAPKNIATYRDKLGDGCSFEHPRCAFVVAEADLDRPFPLSNEAMRLLLRNQCERALRSLTRSAPIEMRVRRVMQMTPGLCLSLSETATQLGMSPRTLSRRLSERGERFETVRDQLRFARARDLLRSTDLSISELAPLVGFEDSSNFARAFTRWSGHAPSDFRRTSRS